MYSYDNTRPFVKIDDVVFGFDGVGLNVLLVRQTDDNGEITWSLPSGVYNPELGISGNAASILLDTTSLRSPYIEQCGVHDTNFANDSDGRLTIAFFALVPWEESRSVKGTDGKRLVWFPIEELPENMVEGTDAVVESARCALRDRAHLNPVVFYLLPHRFSISELQRLIEVINGTNYDRRNFYRKVIATSLLKPEGMAQIRAAHRPPQLFSFRTELYDEMLERDPGMEYPFLF